MIVKEMKRREKCYVTLSPRVEKKKKKKRRKDNRRDIIK